jgi:hypothetical protein
MAAADVIALWADVVDLYYENLERTQKGDLDITPWLDWFSDAWDAHSRTRIPSYVSAHESRVLEDARRVNR